MSIKPLPVFIFQCPLYGCSYGARYAYGNTASSDADNADNDNADNSSKRRINTRKTRKKENPYKPAKYRKTNPIIYINRRYIQI
jgi:hypothetical protein